MTARFWGYFALLPADCVEFRSLSSFGSTETAIRAHYRELPNQESAVLGTEKPPLWGGQTYSLLKGFLHLPLEDAALEHPTGETSQAAVSPDAGAEPPTVF